MRIAFVGDSLTEGIPGASYLALLRERFPNDELVNLGWRSDTVISLHRRIERLRWGASFDAAFLWIGVNDITATRPWLFNLATALFRQPAARSLDEFRAHYRAVLEILGRHAGRVITVPPVFKGEDPASAPNRQGAELAAAIAEITLDFPVAAYLDLRSVFAARLDMGHLSPFVERSVLRLAWDLLMMRGAARMDRMSAQRGLQFTVDGVHLNSVGAQVVAEAFAERMGGPIPPAPFPPGKEEMQAQSSGLCYGASA